MKIISIDPGSTNLGYSVFDLELNKFLIISDIRTKEKELNDKLRCIFNTLSLVFSSHSPNILVYEEPVFVRGMGATGSKMSQVVGVLKTLAFIHNVTEIVGYTATQVKRVSTGNGKADKNDVEKAVCNHFNLQPSVFSSDHASDSVACLLCFLKIS